MKARVTIASGPCRHNRSCPRLSRRYLCLLGLLLTGCVARAPRASIVPTWELASAEPVAPVLVARTRVSFDRPLPAELTQELCPEYALILITKPGDWAEVCRRLSLPAAAAELDLGAGAVIGLQANVGECAESTWPIRLTSVRRQSDIAWVEGSFASGIYYPLQTAGYLELVHAPGVSRVSMVRINHRTFMIHAMAPYH